MTRSEAVNFLLKHPVKFARMFGLDKLTDLHNEWMKDMLTGKKDSTLQAHRGSYKTTCLSVALAIITILLPNKRSLFMRKTDSDVKEVIKQVQKILTDPHTQYFVQVIWGVNLKLTTMSATEITTNLTSDIRGTAQLVGLGIGSSITGKHFDYIFTDDIVNVNDRVSAAERERTKLMYQELQNIKNRGGRIYNTGTPWHKDDAFSLMPGAKKYDCYSTGLISKEALDEIKNSMAPSLFAANYELRHIASEDVLFDNPVTEGDPAMVEQGIRHLDAAYGGADGTAFTVARRYNGKIYVFGKLWHKHVDDCKDDIKQLTKRFNAGKMWLEDNGDKGFLARDLRKEGDRVVVYHENMNKYLKIAAYVKPVWKDIVFVAGTDKEYIEQVCDYNENAEHDDAPDSLASILRELCKKGESEYVSVWS